MAYEFKAIRRVEFADTDMAGIMHYSNFFRFMETAEHAFFRSLGLSIFPRRSDPPVGWPRVHAECDFKRPLAFEDVQATSAAWMATAPMSEVRIRIAATRYRARSLRSPSPR